MAHCSTYVEFYEHEAIGDYFTEIDDLWLRKDHEDFVKAINPIVKKHNKANDAYDTCMKAVAKDKEPNWDKLKDMYAYMLGFNCLNDGPLHHRRAGHRLEQVL